MKNKFPIITLCGSTRFYKEYQIASKALTLEGNVVLQSPVFSQSIDFEWWTDLSNEEKEKHISLLRELHNLRISISDAIFVVNPGGYIGESTKEEIEHAKSKGKKIMYMFEDDGSCIFDGRLVKLISESNILSIFDSFSNIPPDIAEKIDLSRGRRCVTTGVSIP